jgi:hypothetical protein
MENPPQNIIAIGRKRFPIEEIALVEPFEPPAEPSPRFVAGGEEPYIMRRRVVEIRKGPVWGPSDCGFQND